MNSTLEQLLHFRFGPVWDGNLISKEARNHLVKSGFVTRCQGFQMLTEKGVEILVNLRYLNEETWREVIKQTPGLKVAKS